MTVTPSRSSARAPILQAPAPRRYLAMDLIWIIVIVLIVLALLGYFGRSRRRL